MVFGIVPWAGSAKHTFIFLGIATACCGALFYLEREPLSSFKWVIDAAALTIGTIGVISNISQSRKTIFQVRAETERVRLDWTANQVDHMLALVSRSYAPGMLLRSPANEKEAVLEFINKVRVEIVRSKTIDSPGELLLVGDFTAPKVTDDACADGISRVLGEVEYFNNKIGEIDDLKSKLQITGGEYAMAIFGPYLICLSFALAFSRVVFLAP
jgi:hypothetical protein